MAFRERYQKTYGREATPGVGHAYDTVRLAARAFGYQRTNVEASRSAAIEYFRSGSDPDGVTAALRARPDGIIGSSASMEKIAGGQAGLIEP